MDSYGLVWTRMDSYVVVVFIVVQVCITVYTFDIRAGELPALLLSLSGGSWIGVSNSLHRGG